MDVILILYSREASAAPATPFKRHSRTMDPYRAAVPSDLFAGSVMDILTPIMLRFW